MSTEFGEVSIYREDGSRVILGEIDRPYHYYPSGLAGGTKDRRGGGRIG